MKKRYFTLVELLVVVGIVVILAGLVLPAVIGGAQQGRITQAKSDMKAIQMALSQMDQTYSRMLAAPASGSDYLFSTGTAENSTTPLSPSNGSVTINTNDAYNSLIAELTVTGRYSNGSNLYYRHNPRRVRFLDPKGNFDLNSDFNAGENLDNLWRDPWGNRYIVIINVDGSEQIERPDNTNMRIMGKTAVYSCGPNGTDDRGRNIEQGGNGVNATDDDIATWHK